MEPITIDPNHPAERVLGECIIIMRERGRKYTEGHWSANFDRVAEALGIEPELVADVLREVKRARQIAAHNGAQREHDDDSLRDSYIDELNYLAFRIALADRTRDERAGQMEVR